MKARLITAGIGIPVLAYSASAGNLWPLRLLLIAIAVVAAFEFSRIEREAVNLWLWVVVAGFVAAIVIWTPTQSASPLIIILYAVPIIHWLTKDTPAILLFMGWVLLPLLSALSLRAPSLPLEQDWMLHLRENLLILTFLCLWVGDSMAYFVGRQFGRRKLAPEISPNKTWEGAVANLIGAAAAGWAFAVALELPGELGGSLGIMVGTLGQVGDLFQSRWKRGANVKDSGAILPGHGGILDRFDSLLFCLPAANALANFWGS